MSYTCYMTTRQQLSALLRAVNVEALHAASGVSTKTIYRLRNDANAPNLATVERLLAGVEKLGKAKRQKRA